jgi:hypothetical protein
MDLSGYSFEGNIILWSAHPLTINQTTHLTDVILFAPSVIIKDWFSGAFQAYALQSVDVGCNCNWNFRQFYVLFNLLTDTLNQIP